MRSVMHGSPATPVHPSDAVVNVEEILLRLIGSQGPSRHSSLSRAWALHLLARDLLMLQCPETVAFSEGVSASQPGSGGTYWVYVTAAVCEGEGSPCEGQLAAECISQGRVEFRHFSERPGSV